ncbi:MAG: N-acetylmuramoyl-L-alanine amidase [Rhizobiaceae bacterium]|nr:N-acetylmuramoyl-L-alanine amidase [Rhizobiaceae bacterium]
MSVLALQRRLTALGFDPGGIDGAIGPNTLAAINEALDRIPGAPVWKVDLPPAGVVPLDWMPWAVMTRIIFHWTAGQHKASAGDRKHYHILVEGDGKLIRGIPSIDLNDAPVKPGYAAHTLNANGDAIGTSMCGMAGAQESPFKAGPAPMTEEQWNRLVSVHVALCRRYTINVSRKTLLSHAEVQETLGIKQRGKWDVAVLPFDRSVKGARAIGDRMRAEVAARL